MRKLAEGLVALSLVSCSPSGAPTAQSPKPDVAGAFSLAAMDPNSLRACIRDLVHPDRAEKAINDCHELQDDANICINKADKKLLKSIAEYSQCFDVIDSGEYLPDSSDDARTAICKEKLFYGDHEVWAEGKRLCQSTIELYRHCLLGKMAETGIQFCRNNGKRDILLSSDPIHFQR